MRRGGQHVVERRAGGGQDGLDALEDVAGLLADVLAELTGDRVPSRLPGDEDEVAELGGWRKVRVRRRATDVDDPFLGMAFSSCEALDRILLRADIPS
jgi:hypothetical protein